MIDNTQQAEIVAIFGATGSGKTTALLSKIKKPKRKRTMFWSPKEPADQYQSLYAGSVVCRSVAELARAMQSAGRGAVHAVFVPSVNRKEAERQFDVFCRIAKAAGDVTVIADELHTVMRPGWAPDGCNELILMGRAYGVKFFGLSQRPIAVCKDLYSNCTAIRTGRLAFPDDIKKMASTLGVSKEEVAALTGYKFIEKNLLTGQITRG